MPQHVFQLDVSHEALAKDKLREEIKKRLEYVPAEEFRSQGEKAAAILRRSSLWKKCRTLFIFISTNNEIDSSPLLEAALAEGKKIFAPAVRGKRLVFYGVSSSGQAWRKGRFGITEPLSDEKAAWGAASGASDFPALVITPCVALDMAGNRLGHGGGYYDRFFYEIDKAGFKYTALGFCMETQVLGEIPAATHDRKMDGVLTAKGLNSVIPQPVCRKSRAGAVPNSQASGFKAPYRASPAPKDNQHAKPFLKWAGGKRQLLPVIIKHLPENIGRHVYYEPFAGAGAVFFALGPKRAVISDSNEQLILTYNAVKENVESVIDLLKEYKQKNNEDFYYKTRNIDREPEIFDKLSNTEKAARLIYLNKTCFNGLYRVNSKGFFNVPYGNYKNPAICEDNLLRQTSSCLNSNEIIIENKDFEQAVLTADSNSFIYFDPPYHSDDKTNFTNYQADGFNKAEQERLRDVMLEMTDRGIKCLLSNSDTAYIRELYNHNSFEIISVQAKRLINSDPAGRGSAKEVLVKNRKY